MTLFLTSITRPLSRTLTTWAYSRPFRGTNRGCGKRPRLLSVLAEPKCHRMQQGIFIFRELVTGKERNMTVCDIFDPGQEHIGTLLVPFSYHKAKTNRQTGKASQTQASP